MTIKLVLASPNDSTAEHITQVLAEADSISLMQVVREASDVSDALERSPDTDILVVDARLDGGRGLAVARSIASASPLLGIVMLVDQAGPEQFAAAMESGARSVISSASSLAEIVSRLESVAQWVTAARSAVGSDSTLGRGGRVIAVAGAKGGVGTSAVALLLAQSLLGTRTVGLVDFDLQSGDLAAYLGVHTRRSVVDLVDIAGEMSGRILRETSYDVPGGLRLLSAPNDGEREEEMTPRAARAVVSALRFQYDVSIVDVGSHLTEATASVLEEADLTLLVVTPDLPALRSARRTLAMWERLMVRSRSGVQVVLNRQNRRSEVTETLAVRIIETPIDASVPDGGAAFESAMNTASIATAVGPAHTAVAKLGEQILRVPTVEPGDLGEAEPTVPASRGQRRRLRAGSSSGQIAVETPVVFTIAIIVFLLCAQGVAWGTGFLFARNAASEGARTVGVMPYGPDAVALATRDATDELVGPWRREADVTVGPDSVVVRIGAPVVIPGVSLSSTVSVPVQRDDA